MRIAFVSIIVAIIPSMSVVAQDAAHPGQWRHYAGNHASSKYSALDQIDAGNVDDLEIAWQWIGESGLSLPTG